MAAYINSSDEDEKLTRQLQLEHEEGQQRMEQADHDFTFGVSSATHEMSDSDSTYASPGQSPGLLSDSDSNSSNEFSKKQCKTLASTESFQEKSVQIKRKLSDVDSCRKPSKVLLSDSDKDEKLISKTTHEISDSSDSDTSSPQLLVSANTSIASRLNAFNKSRPKVREIAKAAAVPSTSFAQTPIEHNVSHSGGRKNMTEQTNYGISKHHANIRKHCSKKTDSVNFNQQLDNSNASSPNLNSQVKKIVSEKIDSRPVCPYGSDCYRKNPLHFKEYQHIKSDAELLDKKPESCQHALAKIGSRSSREIMLEKLRSQESFHFFLTTVTGIAKEFNSSMAVSINDILSAEMGQLEESVHFNYMFDIPWLVQQYPVQFGKKTILIVHGEQRKSKADLIQSAKHFPNVKFCQAPLPIAFGTHHTKMMFLLYDNGLRIVIHTANLVEGDWYQKTQGIWISPLFPKLPENSSNRGDSETRFRSDLLNYISAYNCAELNPWVKHIEQHDMSLARVYIIASVPDRHKDKKMYSFGHLKMRKILSQYGPDCKIDSKWHLIGQFSSIGSLGATKNHWLCDELLTSLNAIKGLEKSFQKSQFHLIFPSRENVRLSLEGYCGGGSLPYSVNTAKKQPYLNSFLHKWKAELQGRTQALPHIKTYAMFSPDYQHLAWFLVTSANLSKAAWGALEKDGHQLMIRSYELGVLFLPQHFNSDGMFEVRKNMSEETEAFPLPYDIPPEPYGKSDLPWMWDVPCVDKPDSHGMKWCPPI